MAYRFVSKAVEEREVKIELVEERKRLKTIIKYPPADPRDRIDDEYDEPDHSE